MRPARRRVEGRQAGRSPLQRAEPSRRRI